LAKVLGGHVCLSTAPDNGLNCRSAEHHVLRLNVVFVPRYLRCVRRSVSRTVDVL